MRKLDKTKPFGHVVGQHERGARYEQDGLLFNAQGVCVDDVKGEPEAKYDARTTSTADPSLQEQLQRQGGEAQPGTLTIGAGAPAAAKPADAPPKPAAPKAKAKGKGKH